LRKKDIELRYLQEDLKRDDATITSINLSETLGHVVADYAAVIREKKAIVSGNILPTIFGNPIHLVKTQVEFLGGRVEEESTPWGWRCLKIFTS
jgi:hypothetical protein